MKTALTIAGSDSSGGAGIQADIKTMTANGVFATCAVTALTAQNTTGVTDILESTPHFLAEQLDAVFTDIAPDAVKIGMVSSAALIAVIAEKLRRYGAQRVVVDPVMVATSGAKLLRDERYIGKTVYGKRSRDIVGSTHTVKISRNDWVIVPDRHEAIVAEALFEKAQTCMREYREREVMTGGGNPLKRKVICGVCGHTMQRDSRKNGSYRCVMKRLNTGFDCSEEKVPEADILEAVIDVIQVYAQYAVSIDRLLQTRQEQRQLDRKQAQRQLQTLQSREARLDKRLQDLYEGLVEGEISRESFAAQKKALTAQAEEISRTVLELERKISDSDDGSNAVIEQFKSYAGITALTREISIELLHSVTIYPDGRMDIRLNLVDEIEALMETLRRESCTA